MKKLFLLVVMAFAISCGKNDDPWGEKPEPEPTPNLTEINLSQDELSFDTAGGTCSITVYLSYENVHDYNARWEITGGASWCTPSVTKGKDQDEVTFTVDKFQTAGKRTATFVFSCGNVETKLIVTQVGVTAIELKTAGTLNDRLSDFDKTTLTALKITGNLNDEDILIIRELPTLEYLDISELSLTTLPVKAFNSLKLKNVALPNSLTIIPESLFEDCLLESIEIPLNVETIEKSAFCRCSKMTSIAFNPKLKIIKGYTSGFDSGAFAGCSSLTSITIPSSVEIIEADAFFACTKLATIIFEKPSKLKIIGGDYSGYLQSTGGGGWTTHSYGYGAFQECAITSIEIPASVEEIQEAAFNSCIALTTVTFEKESQLKRIKGINHNTNGSYHNAGAFCGCSKLTTFDATNCGLVEYIEAFAFSSCPISLFKIGTTNPPINQGTIGDYGQTLPVFSGLASYSILKVPVGSSESYNANKDWKDFASITELDK